MKTLIYQSPKKDKRRSAPIAENDTVSRKLLEERGWTVVETLNAPDVDAESAAPLPVVEPEAEDPLAVLGDVLTDEQWAALVDKGYTTPDALRAATDDELRDVPTIGPASVRNLRAALAASGEEG